ncbi:MAG: PhoH family protein [Nitrospira sp.]|nr:PhoH family protein [Nitrospira sp.]
MSMQKKIFILDTNVLIHDPTALLRFNEHDIYLPIVVLEELDAAKIGMSEVARNVRQVSRFLDEVVEHANGDISGGVELPATTPGAQAGRLYFYSDAVQSVLPKGLSPDSSDNVLLGVTLDLRKDHPEREVTLISKDINLRIKAHALGIRAEDYTTDQVLDDANLLYSGTARLEPSLLRGLEKAKEAEHPNRKYQIDDAHTRGWYPNQYLYADGEQATAFVLRRAPGTPALLEEVTDYSQERNKVWGIHARNHEQNFALNLLMDPGIEFVTMLGQAGTGKTLLTLAAGLTQTLEHKRYTEIIMTRATVPVGEDIGFLPGTEEEKMQPWMGALEDNLDVLHETGERSHGAWGRAVTHDFVRGRIRIKSLNFMRGRTFLKKFIIIDEAQNLSPHQMKTLITRAGPGSKIVCLGNIAQIDSPYLTETTSGLTYAVDRFKDWEHSGHITLQRGERSRLADYASEIL